MTEYQPTHEERRLIAQVAGLHDNLVMIADLMLEFAKSGDWQRVANSIDAIVATSNIVGQSVVNQAYSVLLKEVNGRC